MIYVFLAEGFEDIEALAPVDIMRRAGLEVETVSVTDNQVVVSSHGVPMLADRILPALDFDDADMIVLPGGLPGATNLDESEELRAGIMQLYSEGKPLAAICAAPLVFGHLGILKGIKATCYPGFETELEGATYTAALCERDGQFITACGPGAAMEFGYALCERMGKSDEANALREGMQYNKCLGR